jgi:hypothetical protein
LSRTCSNTSKNLVDFPKTKFPIWGLYARKLAEKAALFVEYTRMGLRMYAGKTQLLFSSRASNVADTTVEVDGSVIYPNNVIELLGVKYDRRLSTGPM